MAPTDRPLNPKDDSEGTLGLLKRFDIDARVSGLGRDLRGNRRRRIGVTQCEGDRRDWRASWRGRGSEGPGRDEHRE